MNADLDESNREWTRMGANKDKLTTEAQRTQRLLIPSLKVSLRGLCVSVVNLFIIRVHSRFTP
jgi:hypothetical protein